MRNNSNSSLFVTALLIASLVACSSSEGTTSAPSSVTPQISKALAGPPSVTAYNEAGLNVDVLFSQSTTVKC
jgi:hypothetical protein